jgi:hypothetical protein
LTIHDGWRTGVETVKCWLVARPRTETTVVADDWTVAQLTHPRLVPHIRWFAQDAAGVKEVYARLRVISAFGVERPFGFSEEASLEAGTLNMGVFGRIEAVG